MPADAEGAVAFGYSGARLAGAAMLLAWVVVSIVLAVTARNPGWRRRRLDVLYGSAAGDWLVLGGALAALAAQATLAIVAGLARGGEVYRYAVYAERLRPMVWLVTISGVELVAWMAYARRRRLAEGVQAAKSLVRPTLVAWAVLAALAVVIATTGLGIVPDKTGDWGLPAVALLEWQIILAVALSAAVMWAEANGALRGAHADRWMAVAIWAGTTALWLSQPVNPGFSALPPRAPNHEIYPFVDAQMYDEQAQSILVGNGMQEGEIPPRPLYIVFLTFLHLIAGQSYENVIAAQTVVLALFPVALYLVGKNIYGRPVGAAMALLAALRDVTSNFAAPWTDALTYSKLYLSEIPVAIPLALFIHMALRWRQAGYAGKAAFAAGGVLGIAIMIRTQAVAALPVIALAACLADRRGFAKVAKGAALMTAAIALVVTPWIMRNYFYSGQFIFDSPQTETINLALRYNALIGRPVDVLRQSNETRAEYGDRLMRLFREAVATNPGGAATVVANRFLNNCVNNILLFPLRNDLLNLDELLQPSRPFWEHWRGTPTTAQGAVIAFYAALLGLGMAAAWKRLGVWGLAPMGVNLLYHLWTSLALLSGQRFLVGMDWSICMYYMIGLFTLLTKFLYVLERWRPRVVSWYRQAMPETIGDEGRAEPRWKWYAAASAGLLLAGASIPLSEVVFPERYPELTRAQIVTRFVETRAFRESGWQADCTIAAVEQYGLAGSTGRALSPRFYGPGEGEATAKRGYAEGGEARLVFLTTGNRYGLAVLPLDKEPAFFPHAADVILFANPQAPHEVWFVWVGNETGESVYVSTDAREQAACLAGT